MTTTRHPLAETLHRELDWLERTIAMRLAVDFGQEGHAGEHDAAPPGLQRGDPYGDACLDAGLGEGERLALVLALAPWLRPDALDLLLMRNATLDRLYSEFGMIEPAPGQAAVPLPSRATALFVIAGGDLARRIAASGLFAAAAPLARHSLLAPHPQDHDMAAPLTPHPALVARLIAGAG
ncbi:hypothetical protein [Parerythrobacter lacustris]|uniref:Uracil-DNA glycosylase n=1 Tax=Parerythrobacter lacustris TaxID=2969984 RepID=A0ABT1XS74_9SPHN|nr:hypothetical protein [Parerythrobacter lacustris]MCR2834508.1 hypothetical protein [Parerythrobacter lacustris]